MRLTVHAFQTLDGVMQSPGHPEEDLDGGFTAGGWLPALADADFAAVVDSWFERTEALLFGRNTWDIMAGHWPRVTDPDDHVAARLNTAPKYLLTSRPLNTEWSGTVVLDPTSSPSSVPQGANGEGPTTAQHGAVLDAAMAAVADLKAKAGGELQVHGCTRLVHSLHRAGLIDEYRLITFPVTVGAGARTFPTDAPPSGMELIDQQRTGAGALYTVLRPAPFQQAGFAVVDGQDAVRTS